MTDPDPRDQISLSLVLPLIDACDLAGILVIHDPELPASLFRHAFLEHSVELVGRSNETVYIET